MSKEIQEGNKLIAEFMGAKFIEKDPMFMNGNSSFYYFKETGKSERILHYHFSWDWLMPVVEKIESLEKKRFGFHIDPHDIAIVDYKTSNENGVVFSTREECSFLESMYEAVIQFITWYNQQNT